MNPWIYQTELGIPLYWRNEQGKLKPAVLVFLNVCTGGRQPTPEEMKLVCTYCEYYINAPCWLEKHPFAEPSPEQCETVRELRRRAKTLASVESVRRWIGECMEIDLDPF